MSHSTLAESRQGLLETLKRLDLRYQELEQPPTYPAQYTLLLCVMLDEQKDRIRKNQDWEAVLLAKL